MSETTVDLKNKRDKIATISVKNKHGDTYFMTINGDTDEDIQRQIDIIIDHEMAHLLGDNMTSEYAAAHGISSDDPTASDQINAIMDAPANGAENTSHVIKVEDDGKLVARAVIKAPDQLKAVRVLMILAHQEPSNKPTPPANRGTFGQDLNDPASQNGSRKPFDPTDPSSISGI